MRNWIASLGLALITMVLACPGMAEDQDLARVQVREPFLEWRSGPGRGYPVIHVSERGDWVELGIRKTQWLKLRDSKGREGWAHIDDVLLTHDATGNRVAFNEPRWDDMDSRRWELGLQYGQLDSTASNSVNGVYWMTDHLAVELSATQVLGALSETRLYNFNLTHQAFPTWRVAPFFTLGGGRVDVKPKATLVRYNNRSDDSVHAGVGVRIYVTDRYFVRMDLKDYKIFTDRASNEEVTEWKIGLSVFF